jgi:hypothetical protein
MSIPVNPGAVQAPTTGDPVVDGIRQRRAIPHDPAWWADYMARSRTVPSANPAPPRAPAYPTWAALAARHQVIARASGSNDPVPPPPLPADDYVRLLATLTHREYEPSAENVLGELILSAVRHDPRLARKE